ncbi:glycosyltransferase family 2 protein [Paenibacillus sp. MMS18-CY102]|uniref:glycosyltransferase family 2 protein n=1 Tax=Paenibacillus sp. MMS18-CY102 TaxID=2682849 RepID=UPI0013660D2A|nr:glycosyltransferase [Paenibacillus sp. MMS18-CY102]MWC28293.1 glycosyltransferase [Paenibacillus sp. MMS18-CY102]
MNEEYLVGCIIVKNGEASVGQAIASIREHVDAIVLMDTGSTDATISIASQAGVTIHTMKWTDDFALARNTAASKCNSEWILMIDADEQFEWNGKQSLKQWLQQNGDTKCVNRLDSQHIEVESNEHQASTHVDRIYCPREYHYVGRIHERLMPISHLTDTRIVQIHEGAFLHYGYSRKFRQGKHERNVGLLKISLIENPKDGRIHRYLANEYYNAGKYEEAVKESNRALRVLPAQDIYSKSQAYYYKVMSFVQMDTIDAAILTAEEAIRQMPSYADPYGIAAELYYSQGDWQKSIDLIVRYEALLLDRNLLPVMTIDQRELMQLHYIESLIRIGRIEEALAVTEKLQANDKMRREMSRLWLHFRTWPSYDPSQMKGYGRSTMTYALIVKNPSLNAQLQQWIENVRLGFHDELLRIGIIDDQAMDEKALNLYKNVQSLGVDPTVATVTQWMNEHRLDAIMLVEANEQISDFGPFLHRGSIELENIKDIEVHVERSSERLKFHRSEARWWSFDQLALLDRNSKFHDNVIASSIGVDGLSVADKGTANYARPSMTIHRPILLPLDKQDRSSSGTSYKDAVAALLDAFGSQCYKEAFAIAEPALDHPDWTVIRFYRILSSYNLGLMEEASSLLFDALEVASEERMFDFIYLYGKLSQHSDIAEMKSEAVGHLKETLELHPLFHTHYVRTDESDWHATIAELEWQLHRQEDAINSWMNALQLSNYQHPCAFRFAQAVYKTELEQGGGKESVARKMLASFDVSNPAARRQLYRLFMHMHMEEWAVLFQYVDEAAIPSLTLEELPLVSVILPVYNDTQYLFKSIHSVLSQTYIRFELIVVDDGSDGKVKQLISQFHYDSRVKYVRLSTNQGLPAALNNGLDKSAGQMLVWTSADNIAAPQWLERLVAFLIADPEASAVMSDYYHVNDDGIVTETMRLQPYRLNGLLNAGPSFMWRKEAMNRIGGFDESLFGIEDRDFVVRIAQTGTIIHLPEALYYYRTHEESLTSRIDRGDLGGWEELHGRIKSKWLHWSFV